MDVIVLDGPVGTELMRRGIPCPAPGWSAYAIETTPDAIREIHCEYARAGAMVHTANTFRTKARVFPDRWERLAREAVRLARDAALPGQRVAGSIAPLEDCYRPDLSPPHALKEHAELASVLADSGCDLLLCETFPHMGEAQQAVRAAAGTGLETWVSLTPGPDADLLSPDDVRAAVPGLIEAGASAVLVNCLPADRAAPYVAAIAESSGGAVRIGVYANPGSFQSDGVMPADDYAALARLWIDAGASIVGVCCTGRAAHVQALTNLIRNP